MKLDESLRMRQATEEYTLMVDVRDSNGGTGEDIDVRPRTGPTATTPWWVKAFWGVVIILVLSFVTLHLTGHSPGGHTMMHGPTVDHGLQQP